MAGQDRKNLVLARPEPPAAIHVHHADAHHNIEHAQYIRVEYATPSKGEARLVLARAPQAGVQVLRANARQQRGRRLLARLAERQLRPAAGRPPLSAGPVTTKPRLCVWQQVSFALPLALPRSRNGLLPCPHVTNGA